VVNVYSPNEDFGVLVEASWIRQFVFEPSTDGKRVSFKEKANEQLLQRVTLGRIAPQVALSSESSWIGSPTSAGCFV
jgi:hypothetical protein